MIKKILFVLVKLKIGYNLINDKEVYSIDNLILP